MNQVRGIVMIVLAGIAFYQGWKIHSGQYAIFAYSVGVAALALGIYRFTRKPPQPLT